MFNIKGNDCRLVGDVAFDLTALTRVGVNSAQSGHVNLGTDTSANLLQLGLSDVLDLPHVDAFTDSNTTLVSGPGLAAVVAKQRGFLGRVKPANHIQRCQIDKM